MKVAYVFWGDKPHPRRKLCAKSINADFFKIPNLKFHPFSTIIYAILTSIKILTKRRYDCVLVDSGVTLQTAFFVKLFSKRTKIIFYVVEPFFYNFDKINYLSRQYYYFLTKCVDGYLTVSEMIKNEIKIYDDKPTRITMPFIWRDPHEFLNTNSKRNNNFIYIKNFRNETNHQLLIDAFSEFSKKISDSELFIIGKGTKEKLITKNDKIHILDNTDSTKYLNKASFYIHPAFFDPAPISLLEAMIAGLIPTTTIGVGNYKCVEEIDKKLVVQDITKESIIKAMIYLTKLSPNKFKEYSEKSMKIAKRFNKEDGIQDFKNKFLSLIKTIN